ncbi:cation:proton antiporter [Haloarcula onubensis]|uniref:Cation:proton antiporter n=1 Tax=Haloarcula onubensis TaxID=2950539 RepID=A0ABU2FKG4_9EURY|nr:cation:proton antiporter [Halomicroarcula sp. S3CR25-11]MDS0281210.1 cation:proton antiporter [Halomicroarcula sp. S3CR25-11]
MATDPLLAVSVIVALTAVAKLLGARYRVPNVVFLLAFGVVLGQDGLGLLGQSLESEQLAAIVGFAVAVIVFEGAFSLTTEKILATPRATLLLVTVGAAVTFVGMALAVRGLLGLDWLLSLIVAALLVATGPTVVTPVLEQLTVTERVASLLETEGIVNDVTASVLGSAVFSVTLISSRTRRVEALVVEFVTQLGVGALVGLVLAVAFGYVLRTYSRSPGASRVTILGVALLTYSLATLFGDESGVVAVAVAGLVMGNSDIPYRGEIARFGSAVSTLVLGTVYIVLASLIRFEELVALGLAGVAVVLVAMVVVRPLSVFLSTRGSAFSRRERLFVSAVGPRGIIPAATATLFSLQLAAEGVENATAVSGVVFLVILVTVVLEAGGAPQIAAALDIEPMTTLIIGGGDIGRALADDVDAQGGNPVIVERDDATATELRADAYSVVHGDGTDAAVLAEAGAADAERLVATTGDDAVNILACQAASVTFGVGSLVSLVNDPAKVDAFRALGISTITPSSATVAAIGELVTLPSLFDWRTSADHGQTLAEETVVSESVAGTRLGDAALPTGCVVVLVQRGEEFIVPEPNVVLRAGDHLTLLGHVEAVEVAIESLSDGG